MAEYASKDAMAALARAQELRSTVRDGTKWYAWYQVIFGGAAAVMVLSIGLISRPYGVAIGCGMWVAVISGLSVYAARQRVARLGFQRRHASLIIVGGLLYGGVLSAGLIWFPGVVAWWVPGALLVALPGLIGGYLETRQ
ncbi:hypothetical protein HXP44_19610 [Streptomyces sioyaensis]|uniref:Uncharacterized protein n=1 Tax=Streptomyces sioyaensis TaxID=67364 RepID=A0A4Q1R0R7_9ACTN|nr:hypothetical protein [Streptomyces sioyaensis]MBM4794216.1 hypothetical protein [Streptomyces sioyaensis]RXS68615.1 hypothetical protein EST54_08565 [Streptomyces sioyaensis]